MRVRGRAILALCAALMAASVSSASAQQVSPSVPTSSSQLMPVHSPPMPSDWESVTLQLKLRNPRTIAELSQATGLGIQTRRDLLNAALASRTQQQQVVNFLQASGMTITHITPFAVSAMGPRALVDKVLPSAISSGSASRLGPASHFSTDSVRVPQELSGLVTRAIASAHPAIHFRPLGVAQALLTPAPNCTPCLSAANARQIYDIPATALTNAADNITIATLQFSGWDSSSLTDFASNFGLPDPVASGQYRAVSIDGADPAVAVNGGDIEVALDQETLLQAAPAAHQVAYITQNSDQGEIDALNQIATDALTNANGLHYTALSISWGLCEPAALSGGSTAVDGISAALQAVTAAGVTVFASAGDSGGYDCSTSSAPDNTPAVDYPASDPHVIGVGGLTTVMPEPTESAWWDPTGSVGGFQGSGTGGGVSTYFNQASTPWQADTAWQLQNPTNLQRLVPDIAVNGDPSTGEEVFLRSTGSPAGWTQVGGTSMSSPLAAAMLTDIQIAHGAATSYALGNIAPNLYSAGAGSFRDMTDGSNGVYPAAAGYDLATGLGVPLWSQLQAALFGAPGISAPALTNNHTVSINVTTPQGMQYSAFAAGVDLSTEPLNCDSSNATSSVPTSLTVPTDGLHTIWVMGYTTAGKCYASETSVRLDTTPPTAIVSAPTGGFTSGSSTSVTWAAADTNGSGVVTTDVRYARRGATSTSSLIWTGWRNATTARSSTFSNTALASTYCFEVRARDAAGNVGAWSTPRCVTTPTDDRAMATSGNWQRAVSAGYLGGTYTSTTQANASLATHTSVNVHRVGLIATHCPTCGSVSVYVGATRVGTVVLKGSTIGRGFFELPTFSTLKSGVVRFVVVSHAKLVRIDGVLISS